MSENVQVTTKKQKGFRIAFFGIVLILGAVVLILEGLHITAGMGFTPLKIIGGVLLLAWLIYEIVRLRLSNIFFPIAFLFILFKENIAMWLGKDPGNFISSWIVLLAALLLTIGFKVLFPSKGGSAKKLGNNTIYLDAANLHDQFISDNVGATQLYITNKEAYDGTGVIHIHDNVGNIVLHLPKEWRVFHTSNDIVGVVSIPENPDAQDKSITLDISDNVGRIAVVFE